ncbi:thiamine diphosphokinase [Aureimonas jatrophae]|uniref:Thiamine diphosphokinase n=1 Tax=Aureimonas jatrophae TaxID=1166073 RepID=A0A1H0HJT2_9HYPH|nr:thiamine diphosphokinase [Aureimonas jatrophae]MBB3950624.1 thiamine pyrophosphokinase [Aureimonas jatrophae]SDO19357.1 thiamine pyrophosphokinase [Aureimonas jatrophae]
MDPTRFVILLAGPIEPTARLRAAVSGRRAIAADAGIRHARALGVAPELWVGDFDSATPADLAGWPAVERRSLPRDKAETDGEVALLEARARGARDVLLIGAMGGRSDHAFSHLVLLLREHERGLAVAMSDGRERCLPLGPAPVRLEAASGAQFSVLRFSDVAGLTIRGARFPLQDVALPFGSLLTQSNEATGPVELTCRTGRAVVLFQEDGDPR